MRVQGPRRPSVRPLPYLLRRKSCPAARRALILGLKALPRAAIKSLPHDTLAVRWVHRGIGIAVEDDGARGSLTRSAFDHASGHGREGGGDVLRSPRGQTGMGAHGLEQIRIGIAKNDGLAGQTRDNGRLATVALLIPAAEPVPARLGVVAARLVRIDDDETMPLGQGVHPGPLGEIFRRLGATVEHDDQPGDTLCRRGGNIGAIATRSRGAGERAFCKKRPVRQVLGRGCRGRVGLKAGHQAGQRGRQRVAAATGGQPGHGSGGQAVLGKGPGHEVVGGGKLRGARLPGRRAPGAGVEVDHLLRPCEGRR